MSRYSRTGRQVQPSQGRCGTLERLEKSGAGSMRYVCRRSASSQRGLRHIPFPNCQNCHSQQAGGASLPVRTLELWISLCGLDVVNSTSSMSQKRQAAREEAVGTWTEVPGAKWQCDGSETLALASMLGLLPVSRGGWRPQSTQPASEADVANEPWARERTHMAGPWTMPQHMFFGHIQMWRGNWYTFQNKNKIYLCLLLFTYYSK